MSNIVVHSGKKETTHERRNRLAQELQYAMSQYNSKLAELIEAGLDVEVELRAGFTYSNDEALIGHVDISYQSPRKYYGR